MRPAPSGFLYSCSPPTCIGMRRFSASRKPRAVGSSGVATRPILGPRGPRRSPAPSGTIDAWRPRKASARPAVEPRAHLGADIVGARLDRWRAKSWQIAQCAIAAGVAWFVAADLLGHATPFFAPIAAVVSLGTSYGQRLRRVAEVTVGVAVGVFLADLIVAGIGSGWWQLTLIVALAMTTAILLDGGQLFIMQAAVQSIVVATLVPDPDAALTRWTDAVVGGAGGAGGRDRGAGRAAAPTARAGRARGAQGRGAAAGGRRGDGRRRGRARARAARRRPLDRPLRHRAAGRRRRGPGGGGVLAVPGPAQTRRPPDGRPGRPDRPGAAQHPRAGTPHRGRGVPPPAGARVVRAAVQRPRRRRRRSWPAS